MALTEAWSFGDHHVPWLVMKLSDLEDITYSFSKGYFAFSGPKANTSYISLLMAIQHPFSRGNIVSVFAQKHEMCLGHSQPSFLAYRFS